MEIRKFTTCQNIEFEHCIGTIEETEEMKKVPANFFSYRKTGHLIWIHVTATNNIPSILEKGLLKGEGHLGEGVYLCTFEYAWSLKSFMELVYNAYLSSPNADFSFVIGTYEGEYLECVYGDAGHTGYYLVEQDISKENIIGTYKVEKDEFMKMELIALRDLAEGILAEAYFSL